MKGYHSLTDPGIHWDTLWERYFDWWAGPAVNSKYTNDLEIMLHGIID